MTTPTIPLDCDGLADALADFLEGTASDGVRAAVDAHATVCADCRRLLDDLNDLRVEAATLPALTPSRDLWQGIVDRIDARVIPLGAPRMIRSSRRRAWFLPAAAAAGLVLATAGITHVLTRAALTPAATSVVAATPSAARAAEPSGEITSTATERVSVAPKTPAAARLASAEPLMEATEPVFASEITKLRRIVRQRRSELDPKTVAVLEQSIAVMDSAIAQSRAALLKDPASGFLASQLNHSLEKKVELLRTAAQLPPRI